MGWHFLTQKEKTKAGGAGREGKHLSYPNHVLLQHHSGVQGVQKGSDRVPVDKGQMLVCLQPGQAGSGGGHGLIAVQELLLDAQAALTAPRFKPQHTAHPQIPTAWACRMCPGSETSQPSCAFLFTAAMSSFVLNRRWNTVCFPTVTWPLVLNLE